MKDEEQRIAIAEACGWKWVSHPSHSNSGYWEQWTQGRKGYNRTDWIGTECKEANLPDYLNSLDAMHEAEGNLNSYLKHKYTIFLRGDCASVDAAWTITHATVRQRAEAFLRTMDKWTP